MTGCKLSCYDAVYTLTMSATQCLSIYAWFTTGKPSTVLLNLGILSAEIIV
jgi:hypothetical protein